MVKEEERTRSYKKLIEKYKMKEERLGTEKVREMFKEMSEGKNYISTKACQQILSDIGNKYAPKNFLSQLERINNEEIEISSLDFFEFRKKFVVFLKKYKCKIKLSDSLKICHLTCTKIRVNLLDNFMTLPNLKSEIVGGPCFVGFSENFQLPDQKGLRNIILCKIFTNLDPISTQQFRLVFSF